MMKVTKDLTLDGHPLRVIVDRAEVGPWIKIRKEECIWITDEAFDQVLGDLEIRQGHVISRCAPTTPQASFEFLLYWDGRQKGIPGHGAPTSRGPDQASPQGLANHCEGLLANDENH